LFVRVIVIGLLVVFTAWLLKTADGGVKVTATIPVPLRDTW
jgi:hypothetical protein